MARRALPADPWDLDPLAPYDVKPADLRGLPFGTSVRVSDESQENSGSKDLQLRRSRSFARESGLPDSGLVWSRTESGKLMATATETVEQIAAARAGKLRVLIFYDSSRYARNLQGALAVEDQLHAAGCFVVYLDGGEALIASNAATRGTKNARHAENQEYVDRLSRRVGDGIEGHVIRGDDEEVGVVSQAGNAAFGWRRPDRYTVPLVHHPREAPIVLAIVERFLDPSETCATVAAWANAEGYRTRRGNDWTKQAIYDLLTLPLNRGVIGFHTSRRARKKGYLDAVLGSIEPIIVPSLAARVDAKLAEGLRGRSRAVLSSHRRRFIYILGGLARWSCGRKATAQYGGSTPHPRYNHLGPHEQCYPERQSYPQGVYLRHLAEFWSSFRLTDAICDRVLARLAHEDGAVVEDRRHLEVAKLEANLRSKAAEFATLNSTMTALELERLKRETKDQIAQLRAGPLPSQEHHVNLLAAAHLLRQVGSIWGDPLDDALELQVARRDLMVAMFDEVVLWGPRVVSVRPRPAFAALVDAGAYRAGTPSGPRIAVRGRLTVAG
jgi:hypothetical protein